MIGIGAASGASIYRRRGSGRGSRARGGARAVGEMYGPWRRVIPSACVSTWVGGVSRCGRGRSRGPQLVGDVVVVESLCRGRSRSRGPHLDAPFVGGGVTGHTRGPHRDGGLAPSSPAPLARVPAPGPSLSTLSTEAAASSSMSMGSSCQYCLGGDPRCRWARRIRSRTGRSSIFFMIPRRRTPTYSTTLCKRAARSTRRETG